MKHVKLTNLMVSLEFRCLEKPVLGCLIKSEFKPGAVRGIGMFDTRCQNANHARVSRM